MTKLAFTTAVVLLLCCTYSWRTGECAPNCLHSRLDIYNCIPHTDTTWPEPNEYALYRTFIRNNVPECRYRDPNANSNFQIIRPIDDLGNPNVRLLYSPGYLLNRRYANQMLVSYNVQCPKGRLPYLVYNDLHLRDKECFSRCEDYVNVSCATCGVSESCGTTATDNFYSLEQERFSVTFRTSRARNDNGFELSVICFDPINMNKGGCSSLGGIKKRDLEIYRNTWQKHAERIRRQLATPRLGEPQGAPSPIRPLPPPLFPVTESVDVAFSDVVTYRGSTITVSRGGRVIRRIRSIFRLVVRDASGGDHSFTRDAVDLRLGGGEETLRLRGPGELMLLLGRATFLRDSQPFALSANEKRVLKSLSSELFNLIPSTNDLEIADIADIDEDGPILIKEVLPIEERNPIIIGPVPPVPRQSFRRNAPVVPFIQLPRRSVSTLAIRESVLRENSCNPVVRAASTSTLSIASRQNPFMVESIRRRMFPSS